MIKKLDVIINRMLQDSKFKLGFDEAQVTGLIPHTEAMRLIHAAYEAKADKIRNDRDVSTEGKQKRLQTLREEISQQIKTYRQHHDKSEMIQDHKNRQEQTALKIRKAAKPEDAYVAALEAKESRDFFRSLNEKYFVDLKSGVLNNEQRAAGSPLDNIVLQAVAAYSPAKDADNRQHEAVLSALVDCPPWLSPISEELRGRVVQTLRETLAPAETENLKIAIGYDQMIKSLADSLQTIVQEA